MQVSGAALAAAAALAALLAGCRSAQDWRRQADEREKANLEAAQMEVSGRTEPLVIETPAESIRARFIKAEEGWLYFDRNHELAGEDLLFEITLVDVADGGN